jgi:hypothetical protein
MRGELSEAGFEEHGGCLRVVHSIWGISFSPGITAGVQDIHKSKRFVSEQIGFVLSLSVVQFQPSMIAAGFHVYFYKIPPGEWRALALNQM